MSFSKNINAYIAIIVAMIIWSTGGIATKIALQGFAPLTFVTLRFSLAVLMMLIVGLNVRNVASPMHLQKIEPRHIPMFLLAGFVQPFLYYVFETYGIQLMESPTVAEVFLCTSPLFAPLFAFILIREKVTLLNIIGILISTAGVIMMLTIGGGNFVIGSPWGVVLCFAAVIAAVLYTIILRKFPAKYNNLSIVFYVQVFSLIFFIPLWAVLDAPDLVVSGVDALTLIPRQSILAIVYLAAFSSVLAFVLFSYTIRQIGVTRANAFNNIRPVFTAIIMMLIFGEQLPLVKWLAMILVIVGLFICQWQPSKRV